jgi:hypothetical protein
LKTQPKQVLGSLPLAFALSDATQKHSSLLQKFVIYSCKKFYKIGTRILKSGLDCSSVKGAIPGKKIIFKMLLKRYSLLARNDQAQPAELPCLNQGNPLANVHFYLFLTLLTWLFGNFCREKGSLLSFVYKFGQVACQSCYLSPK